MPTLKRLSVLSAFFISVTCCRGQDLLVRTVADSLDTPWEILWGNEGRIWFTERGGRISCVDPADGKVKVLEVIPDVYETGEAGLLGMAQHSDFYTTKPWLYVAYNYNQSGVKERIVRYTYFPDGDSLGERMVLLEGIAGSSIHNGCRLVFGPDKKLYISTGDASVTSNSQQTYNLNGKILRMNEDGSIPNDNPYGNSYVWATGLRNTQGLVWVGDKLYGSEHGPGSNDEINPLTGGRNFGWPNVHGFCDNDVNANEQQFCIDSQVVEPLYVWKPTTVAVAGIDYYASGPISKWEGCMLATTLKASRLIVFTLNSTTGELTLKEEVYTNQFGRLRDICISPDGRVFIATSNRDGRGTPGAQDDRIIALLSPTSVKESKRVADEIKIAGNPSSTEIRLTNTGAAKEIRFTDTIGRIVFTGKIHKQLQIDCSTWENGTYILQYRDDKSTGSLKVVVRN